MNIAIEMQSVDDMVQFQASARDHDPITIDYFPPTGKGEGNTSLELLLMSFASCVCTTLLVLLRGKMGKTVAIPSAKATGAVREGYPKSLRHIRLDLNMESCDLTEKEAGEALAIAEKSFCPVWAMIRGNVDVDVRMSIGRPK